MYYRNFGQFGQAAPAPRPSGSVNRSPLFPSPGAAAQPYTICVRKLPRTFSLTTLVPLGPDEDNYRQAAYDATVVREWRGDEDMGRAYCVGCRDRATVDYVMIVEGPNIQYQNIWDSPRSPDNLIRSFDYPSYLAKVGGFPVQMVYERGATPPGQIVLALTNELFEDGFTNLNVELPVWNQAAQQWTWQNVTENGVVFDTEVGRVPLAVAAPGKTSLTLADLAYICQFGKLRTAPNRGVRQMNQLASFGAARSRECWEVHPKGQGCVRIECTDGTVHACGENPNQVSARPSRATRIPAIRMTGRNVFGARF